MPKRRRPSPPQTEAFEQIDVSPLIDVSFLLLIFFLVTSIIQKSETDLATQLAGPYHPGAIEPLTIDIEASADGTIRFNQTTVSTNLADHDLDTLVDELEQAKELSVSSGSPVMAIIDIADDASQQRFADVLNALAAAKIENVAIQ